jgi:multiple sugar transport system permease protein
MNAGLEAVRDRRPALNDAVRRPRRLSAGSLARVATLVVVAAAFLFLLVTFIIAAFRTRESMSSANPVAGLSWGNLRYDWIQVRGFGSGLFATWYENSLLVCAGGTALSLLSGIPAGYALAKLRFPFRRTILVITLLMMVIPNTVLVIPLFLEVTSLHQLGQLWPLAVILGFFPFGTYLAFIHFDTALPTELIEAARVDGLSEIGIFARVALPVSKQAVAIVAFFAFLAAWTNYFLPLVLLPSANQATLTVGLQQLISGSQLYDPSGAAGSPVQLYMPQLVFAAVLQTAPLLVIFLVAQRFLARGATVGAVKQ